MAYGGISGNYVKDINTIMTTGAKQERFPAYYNGDIIDGGYEAAWSILYTVPISSKARCEKDGKWVVN